MFFAGKSLAAALRAHRQRRAPAFSQGQAQSAHLPDHG
jgi:hypothetical protein